MSNDDSDETIEIAMPMAVTVLVYKSETKPGWITKVMLTTTCVETGEPDTFAQTTESPAKLSRQELADIVVDMLAHEVAEQLGLGPHQRGV